MREWKARIISWIRQKEKKGKFGKGGVKFLKGPRDDVKSQGKKETSGEMSGLLNVDRLMVG